MQQNTKGLYGSYARPADIKGTWYVVDAEDQVLGRLATRIATVLRGKHNPLFTPHMDLGDHVIVINAEKVRLTGRKLEKKGYFHYTGYPGGIKARMAKDVRTENPERMVREAVWGMLPKNRLSRQIIKKLKVYGGATHPHEAQSPELLPDWI